VLERLATAAEANARAAQADLARAELERQLAPRELRPNDARQHPRQRRAVARRVLLAVPSGGREKRPWSSRVPSGIDGPICTFHGLVCVWAHPSNAQLLTCDCPSVQKCGAESTSGLGSKGDTASPDQ
jgi:hypothetical protein